MFSNINLNQIVVMIVPLLFSVTIHEVAHGYIALRMGDHTAQKAGRLTLNPIKHLDFFGSLLLPLILKLTGSPIIFGYAKPVPVNFLILGMFEKVQSMSVRLEFRPILYSRFYRGHSFKF